MAILSSSDDGRPDGAVSHGVGVAAGAPCFNERQSVILLTLVEIFTVGRIFVTADSKLISPSFMPHPLRILRHFVKLLRSVDSRLC